MTVSLAVALLALLVALFSLVALVAVYARVRALEAAQVPVPNGYPALVGTPAPAAVWPGPDQRRSVVAVLAVDCGTCHDVLAALAAQAAPEVRAVAVADRSDGVEVPAGGGVELLVDPAVRAELYEGYAPTLLAVDAAGTVRDRHFVHADTDVAALVRAIAADDTEAARA